MPRMVPSLGEMVPCVVLFDAGVDRNDPNNTPNRLRNPPPVAYGEPAPAEVHTAKHAAQQSKIPLPMASKILKALAKGGLARLAARREGRLPPRRDGRRISIGDVIQALEGPIGITECSFNPGACEQEGSLPRADRNWKRISVAMRDALDKIPLSDMAAPPMHQPDVRLLNVTLADREARHEDRNALRRAAREPRVQVRVRQRHRIRLRFRRGSTRASSG